MIRDTGQSLTFLTSAMNACVRYEMEFLDRVKYNLAVCGVRVNIGVLRLAAVASCKLQGVYDMTPCDWYTVTEHFQDVFYLHPQGQLLQHQSWRQQTSPNDW